MPDDTDLDWMHASLFLLLAHVVELIMQMKEAFICAKKYKFVTQIWTQKLCRSVNDQQNI